MAEEWVCDKVPASVTRSQPVSVEAMAAAEFLRKDSLAPEEMVPFIPLEKSPEPVASWFLPGHPWKRTNQRES